MTNLEKYDRLFLTAFRVKPEELPGLKYRGIPLWDSLGHMDLMGDMEETFKISIGTADVLDFSSYEKGKEILAKYGVEMIGCDLAAIERGEDRKLFNDCMAELGIETARSGYAYSIADAEAIVADPATPDGAAAIEAFLARVDAAAVYANASTAFTDGGQFGLGAEIGISTQKLHARGPFALAALTSYKYVLRGSGQVRA